MQHRINTSHINNKGETQNDLTKL